uniref:Interleukin-4 n=1 Tax=Cyanistes caeruleus TaxID=156563 RepID=A0A8C0ZE44_CYACU
MLSQRKVMSTGLTLLLGPGRWTDVCLCVHIRMDPCCLEPDWSSPLYLVKVSCNKMSVRNIFADYKRDNNMEILCKAATIAREGQSCHRYLEGIYHNLLSLKPCPVAANSTTSLKNFLKELHQVLQEEYKSQKSKDTPFVFKL